MQEVFMNEPLGFVSSDNPRNLEHDRGEGAGGGSGSIGRAFESVRAFGGFDVERAAYEQLKPSLLAEAEGKFVVLVKRTWEGPFDTFEEAERAGYLRFGFGPLYIKRVAEEEPVERVSRDM